ncbi:hypothetical protein JK205_09940 [Gluconobacter cerinus]|nr:hypothetical protein [Gluconobacter cerinus]MBS1019246.1 hypothetical protein [Gluconobacter cerinus]
MKAWKQKLGQYAQLEMADISLWKNMAPWEMADQSLCREQTARLTGGASPILTLLPFSIALLMQKMEGILLFNLKVNFRQNDAIFQKATFWKQFSIHMTEKQG